MKPIRFYAITFSAFLYVLVCALYSQTSISLAETITVSEGGYGYIDYMEDPIYFGPNVIQSAIDLNGISENLMGWGDGDNDTIIVSPGVYNGFWIPKADLKVELMEGVTLSPFNEYANIIITAAGSSVEGCDSCSICYDMDMDDRYVDDYLMGGKCIALDRSDCDDDNASIYAVVNGYIDMDGDGLGDHNDTETDSFCTDGSLPELYSFNNYDCDDTRSDITYPKLYYQDADNDGFGNDDVNLVLCTAPYGYVDVGMDCNDGDPSVNPNEIDLCDALDNDCDGLPDPDCFTDGNIAHVNSSIATTTEYGLVATALEGLTHQVGIENLKILKLLNGSFDGFTIDIPNIIIESAPGVSPVVNGTPVGPDNNTAVHIISDNVSLLGLTIELDTGAYQTGFRVDDVDQVSLNYNSLIGGAPASEPSTPLGLLNTGSFTVDARINWWGSIDGPSGDQTDACDNDTLADGSGKALTELSCFSPYLFKPFTGSVEKRFVEGDTGLFLDGAIKIIITSEVTATSAVAAALFDGPPVDADDNDELNDFFGVYIPDISGQTSRIQVSRCDETLSEDSLLNYYDGEVWQPVIPEAVFADGCITFQIDNDSDPSFDRLNGLLFSIGNDSEGGSDGPTTTTTTISGGGNPGGGGGGGGGSPTTIPANECEDDFECDDGVFCNGAEICITGQCAEGVFPCESEEICDEDQDLCTAPTPAPDCISDAECDNGLFCDGSEICENGACVNSQPACVDEQQCSETLQLCFNVARFSADPIQRFIVRPRLRQLRCSALVLRLPVEDLLFAADNSQVDFSGPDGQTSGVIYNDKREIRQRGRLISVPLCIDKDAEPGPWNVIIQTQTDDPDDPWIERIFGEIILR